MYGYIYKITNLLDSRIYVGQHKATKFDENYWGSSKFLKRDIETYGIQNFTREVICECESNVDMNEKERYWISTLNAKDPSVGYNRCDGGQSNSGFKQSDYQKRIMKEKLTGKPMSESAREHMRQKKYGNHNASGGKGQIFVHFGEKSFRVWPKDIDAYLECGYLLGIYRDKQFNKRMKEKYTHCTYINNGSITKCVDNSELDNYLSSGWVVGHIKIQRPNMANTKRGRMAISKDGKVNYIDKKCLQYYLDNGWTIGRVQRNR